MYAFSVIYLHFFVAGQIWASTADGLKTEFPTLHASTNPMLLDFWEVWENRDESDTFVFLLL